MAFTLNLESSRASLLRAFNHKNTIIVPQENFLFIKVGLSKPEIRVFRLKSVTVQGRATVVLDAKKNPPLVEAVFVTGVVNKEATQT
ncbi:MAG: hypothetical protein LBF22_13985 [Deltaproteobacteria bacterium]|nr:hypothetical protein [Deltaproteobacteria bacterium]